MLYYGESSVERVTSIVKNSGFLKGEILESPQMDYQRKTMNQMEIYVLNYDLKKSEILFLSKGTPLLNKINIIPRTALPIYLIRISQ